MVICCHKAEFISEGKPVSASPAWIQTRLDVFSWTLRRLPSTRRSDSLNFSFQLSSVFPALRFGSASTWAGRFISNHQHAAHRKMMPARPQSVTHTFMFLLSDITHTIPCLFFPFFMWQQTPLPSLGNVIQWLVFSSGPGMESRVAAERCVESHHSYCTICMGVCVCCRV